MKYQGLKTPRVFALVLLMAASAALSASAETESIAGASASASSDDPYLWLEEVIGQKALDWVRQQNSVSTNELQARPDFEPIRRRLLSIMDSKDRIPFVSKHGKFVYNFWRDDRNVRGLWRRATLKDYKSPAPNWETVLDLDQLAATEKENWVWKAVNVLEPDYDRCLI